MSQSCCVMYKDENMVFHFVCRASSDFITVLQYLIHEVIPSQKWHMKMGPILSGYKAVDRSSR
jgi:hypothetical protein